MEIALPFGMIAGAPRGCEGMAVRCLRVVLALSVFAGMALGQTGYVTCSGLSGTAANPVFIPSEGTSEQVGDLTLTCDRKYHGARINAGCDSRRRHIHPELPIARASVSPVVALRILLDTARAGLI